MRQYRKLDDQVVTRLNRAQAQLRDEARLGKGSSPEGMCAKMWTEMICECLLYCDHYRVATSNDGTRRDADGSGVDRTDLGDLANPRALRIDVLNMSLRA